MKLQILIPTEEWKDIVGYEGLYQVSNKGNVRSLPRRNAKNGILKPIITHDGYLTVGLCKNGKGKIYKIHRLVATAFIDNPNNLPCINHINEFDKFDNSVENLEWCTVAYNNNYGTGNARRAQSKNYKEIVAKSVAHRNQKAINEKLSKAILQFSINGDFIKEWKSGVEVFKELGYTVYNACLGKVKKTHGFIWKYKEDCVA